MFNRDKAREMIQEKWVCSSEKAVGDLGWSPRIPVEEGLATTAKWYREHGFL
jgi:nucleoside-diphosphate-sugar epimerase